MLTKFKNIFFITWLFFIFILAISFWYSPILFKGYPAQNIDSDGMITIARNYTQHNVLGLENDLNVVVAPSLVESQANNTSLGNKFTIFSYVVILRIFGQLTWEQIVLLAIILHAISLVFFTITVFYLFGFKESLVFPLVYILLPINWQTVYFIGTYEFALIFFSLFTIFFFCFKNYKNKWAFLILSGIFLALSGLAREALFLFFPILFLWLWFNKRKKDLLLVFIPVFLMLLFFWLPSFFNSGNDYLKLFVKTDPDHSDLHYYGHIYTDPYTYHFNKESVLKEIYSNSLSNDSGWLYRISRQKAGANMGVRKVNFIERLSGGTVILSRHISKFLSIEDIGGPLIFLLMISGLYYLKQKDKNTYLLFIGWLIAIPLILSYIVLAVRNHLMDFNFVIVSLISLGLVNLISLIKNYYKLEKSYKIFYVIIVLIVLYSLVLANHVFWGRVYDSTEYPQINYLANKIDNFSLKINNNSEQQEIIDDIDVIAVGRRSLHPSLNYLTQKSVVFFSTESINKLINDHQLQEIFDKFGIRYIIGYDDEISDLIIKNSSVKNIANWPHEGDVKLPSSYSKEWFLNMIK